MKKLMIAMCLAGALCAFSADDDAAPKDEGAAPARREMRGGPRPQRQMTAEQRKEFEARHEKFRAEMKARREEAQKKMLAVLMEAGLDEAKAKETLAKLGKIQMESRPRGMGPGMGPGDRPGMGPGMGPDREGGRQARSGRQGQRRQRPQKKDAQKEDKE